MDEYTKKDVKNGSALVAGAAVVAVLLHIRNRRIRRSYASAAADYIGSMRAAAEIVTEKIHNGEYRGKAPKAVQDDFSFFTQVIHDKL